MPYVLVGNCVHKQNTDGSAGETVPGGCHDNPEEAKRHMRALYANVKDSAIAEFSLTIVKASYDKDEPDPNRKQRILMVSSDTKPDLYDESMSVELFRDFISHIENNDPVPEQFKSVVCEDSWCGGVPYISIAHYRAGKDAKNVPGTIESVYLDGNQLKSKAFLHDTPLGRKLFQNLCADLKNYKSGADDYKPIRVSIGFLDLEHVHEVSGKSFIFTRAELGQKCALCEEGVGGKIYKKGYLVHEAATRVPVNQRTEMSLEEKSMGDIITKKDDAASIVGEDLANELEEKSLGSDVLVVKAEGTEVVNTPVPEPFKDCYDPNTSSFDQACINNKLMQYMVDMRNEMHTVKSQADEVVEEAKRKDVSESDKKRAEKKYGDVKYADEENRKYPIDTEEHVRAALSYWGMPKNRSKYSPEDQKKIGGRIRAAAKKFGIDVTDKKSDAVEEIMETEIVDKAKSDEAEKEDNPKEEMDKEEMDKEHKKMHKSSALDQQFESLKSLLASGKSLSEVQEAFNALGKEVEKSYAPAPASSDDIASIVRSAVEAAVAPLRMELATLKAAQVQPVKDSDMHPVSRALTLKPAELMQKSQQANEQLSQIQMLARKSVGL